MERTATKNPPSLILHAVIGLSCVANVSVEWPCPTIWSSWFCVRILLTKKTAKGKPAEISVVFDCAPYHIGFHHDVDDEGDVRFDPLKTGRPELVQRLMDLGCDEPTVLHTVMSKTKSDVVDESIIKMAVAINSDEKTWRCNLTVLARAAHLVATAALASVGSTPGTKRSAAAAAVEGMPALATRKLKGPPHGKLATKACRPSAPPSAASVPFAG
jgi:hypothetical protein